MIFSIKIVWKNLFTINILVWAIFCFLVKLYRNLCVGVCMFWLSPPRLWRVQTSGWWRRCASCPHRAHYQCRPHPHRRCHPGRRSVGCPCWGSRRTGRTDAPRFGSPGHSLLPPAKRDTWWILGVQAGRMDRRIAREQERRKKDKQSRTVEHYWQETGRHTENMPGVHTHVAAESAQSVLHTQLEVCSVHPAQSNADCHSRPDRNPLLRTLWITSLFWHGFRKESIQLYDRCEDADGDAAKHRAGLLVILHSLM